MTSLVTPRTVVPAALADRVSVEVRLGRSEASSIGIWAVDRRDGHHVETCIGAALAINGQWELRRSGKIEATSTDLADLAMIAAALSSRSAAYIVGLRDALWDDPYFSPDFIDSDGRHIRWYESIERGLRTE